MKTIIRKLLKCSPGSISWEYGRQDFNTISGRLKYLFYLRLFYVREWGSNLRWRLANWLAFWAARLRGNRNYDLGYGIEANLAAMLEDSVRWRLLLLKIDLGGETSHDEIDDAMDNLEVLAALAKASCYHDYRKIAEENR